MPFRASNALPAKQLERAKSLAFQLKRLASRRSVEFSTGASSAQIIAVLDNLRGYQASFQDIQSTPGIAAYASDQENDAGYDVATEFTALLATIDDAIATIVADLPKDGGGFLLLYTINPDGELIPRTFTGAALTTLRADLDAIDAAVT